MNRRILIADDEKNMRWVLREALEPVGYDVAEASEGKEALSAIAEQEPDLLVLDHRMPAPDGMEVLRRLRGKGYRFPVIMLTGVKALNTVVEVMKAGAQDYLVKPINVDELLISVRKSIEFKRLKEQNILLQKENERYQQHLEDMVEKRSVQLKDALFGSLIIIASAIEAKD
jgi:DNA-binding NtrC family response regulator